MIKIKKPLIKSIYQGLFVDPLGLEPRTTEPKSDVLPITPWVNIAFAGAKITPLN